MAVNNAGVGGESVTTGSDGIEGWQRRASWLPRPI